MTIRKKSLIIIAIVAFALIVVSYAILRGVITRNIASMERGYAVRETLRIIDAIWNQAAEMDRMGRNLAMSDDTYAFIENGNERYIKSNLADQSICNLRLNLVLYVDLADNIVYGTGFDLKKGVKVPIPKDIPSHIRRGDILIKDAGLGGSLKGIILLADGPMLIVSSPILTSQGNGPVRGSLINGRYLNQSIIEEISQLASVSFDIQRLDENQTLKEYESMVNSPDGRSVFVKPLSEREMAGYAIFRDIYGKPALIMHAKMGREIFEEGKMGLRHLSTSVVALALVFALVITLLLEKFVISPVARLSADVASISRGDGMNGRVGAKGRDEISKLASSINVMLNVLEESRQGLKKMNEELSRINQVKSEITSMVSHELRTPLAAIRQSIDVVTSGIKGHLNNAQVDTLGVAVRNIDRLMLMVENVLNFSRLESVGLEIAFEEADVGRLVNEAVKFMKPLAESKGVEISVDVPQKTLMARCDANRMQQVITNLLDNGIKYTKGGGKVGVRLASVGDIVEIEVWDTGIGIKQEDREQVFEIYAKANGRTRTTTGTGIGLAVCKAIVERHGGSILVESEYNKEGSRFFVRFPAVRKCVSV